MREKHDGLPARTSYVTISRIGLEALAVFAFLTGCPGPTDDPAELAAIKAESQILMSLSVANHVTVPKSQWPRFIASLEPEFVTVRPDGVDVMTVPDFDGGWGYFVPRSEREPPEPAGRFRELSHGIYWYHPY